MLYIIANFEITVTHFADPLDSVWSNVSVKYRVIAKLFRFYKRSTVRDSALRPQALGMYTANTRGAGGGYADGTRLTAAGRTNACGVEYCLKKKSFGRAGVVSQWSHNAGSIWSKVVSIASRMNFVG